MNEMHLASWALVILFAAATGRSRNERIARAGVVMVLLAFWAGAR